MLKVTVVSHTTYSDSLNLPDSAQATSPLYTEHSRSLSTATIQKTSCIFFAMNTNQQGGEDKLMRL